MHYFKTFMIQLEARL